MKFFKKRSPPAAGQSSAPRAAEYKLFGHWSITFPDVEDIIDNGDSIQLYNDDFIVYASSLVIKDDAADDVAAVVAINAPVQNSLGGWDLEANVKVPGSVLVLVVTYQKTEHQAQAEAIIKSAHSK